MTDLQKPIWGWNKVILIGLVGITSLLSACTSKPVVLSYSEPVAVTRKRSTPDVKIFVRSVTDRRERNAILTDVTGRVVEGTDLIEWSRSNLIKWGMTVAGIDGEGPPVSDEFVCEIDVELRKAELNSFSTTKMSTIVLGVPVSSLGDKYRVFRGSDSTMNWANSSDEMNNALERAMSSASNQIIEACALVAQGK